MEDASQVSNIYQATVQLVGTRVFSEEEAKLIVSSTVKRRGKRVMLTIETTFIAPQGTLSRSCTSPLVELLPYDLVDLSICLKHLSVTPDTTKILPDTGYETDYTHRSQWCIYEEFFGVFFLMYCIESKRWGAYRILSFIFPRSRRTNTIPKISQRGLKTSPEAVLEFANQIHRMYDEIVAISDARTPEDVDAEMHVYELQAKRQARIQAKGNLGSDHPRKPAPPEP